MKADDLVQRIGGRTPELLGDPQLDRARGNGQLCGHRALQWTGGGVAHP
jgi:hypothetical protein